MRHFVVGIVVLMALLHVGLYVGSVSMKKTPTTSDRGIFRLDFIKPPISHWLYRQGISMAPGQVVVGWDGWLFLGDDYEASVSSKRQVLSERARSDLSLIYDRLLDFDTWLKELGVSQFAVLIAPDKGTVYPEKLPDWVEGGGDAIDVLLAKDTGRRLLVDVRDDFDGLKHQQWGPLYYAFDSHWNLWGASAAFKGLADHLMVKLQGPSTNPLPPSIQPRKERSDLADILHLGTYVEDLEYWPAEVSLTPCETQRIDFWSRHQEYSGPPDQVSARERPLLLENSCAPHQRKVLWLRDSFGTAMVPPMVMTFSEVLQMRYDASGDEVERVVRAFRPDLVVMTVAERKLATPWIPGLSPQVHAKPLTLRPSQ